MLTLAGGSTLSYANTVSILFAALGKPERVVHLPEGVLSGLLHFFTNFVGGHSINVAMIKRQRTGLVFSFQPAQELLGYNPLPFYPEVKDFSLPELSIFKG